MNRREFIKTSTGCAAYAAFGMAVPGMLIKATAAKDAEDITAMNKTAQAVAAGNLAEAERQLDSLLAADVDAWQIHRSLFAVVQRVLNPPYINPHLPKMYAVYRYFSPYLQALFTAGAGTRCPIPGGTNGISPGQRTIVTIPHQGRLRSVPGQLQCP
jgi:hypothetical protein